MPIVLLPIASGTWRYALVDVDGQEHGCNAEDAVSVLAGPAGLLMPPVSLSSRELPLRAGSRLQGVRVATREFDLPLLIKAASLAAVVDTHEQLLTWVDPTRGDVAWRVTRPDGTRRELLCTYLAGLEGEETLENGVETWWEGVATFRAHEPYWRDVDPTVWTYAVDALAGSWFPMTFPVRLAGSQVFRVTGVVNSGSAEAYPTWTIVGPGTDPVLRNLTTGKHLGLALALAAGESLIVDTAPLVELPIRDGGGNSRFDAVTSGSERWPLIRGANSLQIELTGANADSRVTLEYRRRWLRR